MIKRDQGRYRRLLLGIAVAPAVLALAACGGGGEQQKGKGGAGGRGGAGGPAQVGYVVVQPTSVPMTTELAGRVVAFQSSEVRPQVSGVIQRRFFTEGSIVKKGQPLYQIDPSLYRASANEAQASVANAQANAEAARIRADRYRPLAEIEAISKQDYTDAVATQRQAQAQIALNKAQLDTARINLRFTTVPAPITGRIGRSLFTVGALVSATQTDPLTTIQQLDPIFVDIQQSSAELLALRRALASGGAVPARADVRLMLEDGSDYGLVGSVEFAEVVVDQSTGTVTLRARFPNPRGLLLPGMFVRAQFSQSIDQNAFLVPQQAVSRDPKGNATVWLVGPGNKAVERTVTAERAQGVYWVVTDGLKNGDKIITQGTGTLKANAPIRPVPANTPQKVAPPPSKDGKAGQGGDTTGRGQGGQSKAG
ncbi:membrane fusion protein, multidrug efflux system [Sphingomonas palmae]|uniref:Membrane fusion protein, multidrug efflux system n=1 Tax=Sphingomonas palmae TaxID=1855283 RepID=A0A1H7HX19_9SPHN|nr:efflux RND transporter periplasmic adaptor subunit [Sphingomonas palmae]SEK54799.1 membrane fusion protein, multidrug efflux system [Sphingomonas palmae]